MKSKVDKIDVDKLVPVPVDLSKLRDAAKNNFVKKTEYDELVKNVNSIQSVGTRNLGKKITVIKKLMQLEKSWLWL